jgi:4-alpha-glucanotransferase
VVDAAVDFVTRTPSPLVLVPIEDLLGGIEQPNLPGTTDEYPNWSHRLSAPASDLLEQPITKRRVELLARRKS